ELTKENQEAFEAGMLLNMGQILSIPFIIIGAIFITKALRKRRR
ncbi:MAG: prolipoprotein diacylglyceryl transferase, partial [Prevotella sp.]|nr:prolipoprotein diacylglyceryl transferase [Prevotella sp.]